MSKSEVSDATSFESATEQPIELPLIAFCVDPDQRMALVPAPSTRAWVDLLSHCRFPPAPQARRIIIPIVIGDHITR